MGQQSYQYSHSTTWYVPSDVKCAYVITVGGGGSGGGPTDMPGWGRGDWGQSGGGSSSGGFGASSGGGGGGGVVASTVARHFSLLARSARMAS